MRVPESLDVEKRRLSLFSSEKRKIGRELEKFVRQLSKHMPSMQLMRPPSALVLQEPLAEELQVR